jgi:predicted phage baseplate assembly protein
MGAPANVPASGVRTAELVRVALVRSEARQGSSDTFHSVLVFDRPLRHSYKRDTVIVYGNVVAATHGETRKEVLGSGDATRPYQTFPLRQAPVTFTPSPTASGIASSLEVRVNDLTWHEVDTLADVSESDRVFISELDDKGGIAVTFGGGARLPTGIENVKAEYRVGIGAAGNARPWQISQLMDRPLGAKEVTNPLAAEGGADRDTADQARAIASASLKALDRLISVSDYQHFARLFAGIAKATASETWAGGRPGVVVTVAAAGGLPIAGSALHAALVSAMRRLGDPSRSVEVIDFRRHLLVLEAGVRVLPDYAFEFVEPRLRQALLDAFSFDRRRLGEDLPLAQVVATMQGVAGVHSVDVDVFATVSADDVVSEEKLRAMFEGLRGDGLPFDRVPTGAARAAAAGDPRQGPGWLVYASPRLPRTLRLKEIS